MSKRLPVTGNTEHTAPENRAYFPALDGLRGTAFLLVFFEHYAQLPWGWAGVNIFFVLSGLLITGILFDTRDDPHRARNFYIRRTLRIFPLYYGIFLGLVLLNPWFHWRWSIAWLAWPLYLGNLLRFLSPRASVVDSSAELAADAHLGSSRLPNTQLYFGHFWSLCVEEQFYLFWPRIVFKTRKRLSLLWICATIVVVIPILRVVAHHTAPLWMLKTGLLYSSTPFQLDALFLGGLLALLWRGAHREQLLLVARSFSVVATAAAALYLIFTVHLSDPHWCADYVYPAWMYTGGLVFVNFFSASLIVCALRNQGIVYRLFRQRALRWLGRISYGAYVFHDILHGLYLHMTKVLGTRFATVAAHAEIFSLFLGLTGTIFLAWLSFKFFEAPFLNLKERWTVRV